MYVYIQAHDAHLQTKTWHKRARATIAIERTYEQWIR